MGSGSSGRVWGTSTGALRSRHALQTSILLLRFNDNRFPFESLFWSGHPFVLEPLGQDSVYSPW